MQTKTFACLLRQMQLFNSIKKMQTHKCNRSEATVEPSDLDVL